MPFKMRFLSTSKFVYFNEKLHCVTDVVMTLLVAAESVMLGMVITLFLTLLYPMMSSNVI